METSNNIRANTLQFRSKSIISYQQTVSQIQGHYNQYSTSSLDRYNTERFLQNVDTLKKREKYTGMMTTGARKRLTKAISLLIQSSPKKYIYNPVSDKTHYHHLTFITLTLPDVSKSKDASFCHKYLLQPMLRVLRNKYKMKSYVWKCELQKNGSIHYHLTTDLFIVHTDLKNEWNNITRRNGLLEEFKSQYGHDNPNSTDIHAVSNINDIEAYLVKYISKEYQNEVSLKAKIWDCSKNLKESKYFTTVLTPELHEAINNEIDQGFAKVIKTEHCYVIKFSTTDYISIFPKSLISDYHSHLTKITTWNETTSTTKQKELKNYQSKLNPLERTKRVYQSSADTKSIPTSIAQSSIFQMTCYGMYC